MLVLNRLLSDIHETRGILIYNRTVLCHALELPWLGNVQNRSCIPLGEYDVIKANSPKHGECFYIKNVPLREGILIHSGNYLHQTQGCILVGLDAQKHTVLHSRNAMHRLLQTLPADFKLIIRNI